MISAANTDRQELHAASLGLLVSLLLSLLIVPLLENFFAGRFFILFALTSIFLLATLTARSWLRSVAVALLVIALPTAWATLYIDSKPLFVAHCLLGSAFFWYAGGVVVYNAIRPLEVTFDSVFGAISAYLLIGLGWALAYWGIHALSPDAFAFDAAAAPLHPEDARHMTEFSHYVYYSFVTMSTVGFGDIIPTGRITRTLSWMQSITGQFYVAVVIAWLVSALPRPGRK